MTTRLLLVIAQRKSHGQRTSAPGRGLTNRGTDAAAELVLPRCVSTALYPLICGAGEQAPTIKLQTQRLQIVTHFSSVGCHALEENTRA